MIPLRTQTQTAQLNTASTSIPTGSWVKFCTLTKSCSYVSIFNPSGSTILIATDSAGTNQIPFSIPPGGVDEAVIRLGSGQDIYLKALDTAVTSGYVSMNFHD